MDLAPNSAGTLAPEGGTQSRKTIRDNSQKANCGYEECGLQNKPARWNPGSSVYELLIVGNLLRLTMFWFPDL